MTGEVLWRPPDDVLTSSNIGHFLTWLRQRGFDFATYQELWEWSVSEIDEFWTAVWDYYAVGERRFDAVRVGTDMHNTRWFSGALLNYAARALARTGDGTAIHARSHTRGPNALTWDELRRDVAAARAGLERLGVKQGDRVAAYMPNIPEAVVAFLACAAMGAVWCSCAPEFGVRAVVDRFAQLEPVVLIVVDGYRHRGKPIDRREDVKALRRALPSVQHVVSLSYLDPQHPVADTLPWQELVAVDSELRVDALPAEHPLFVLFSSGTSGLPKAIVHGHGGILLEHLKQLGLHNDLRPDSVLFSVATTSWMVWNYMISALCHGAAIVCFDGDPMHPDLLETWRVASETKTTDLGLSAAFIAACAKACLEPARVLDLAALRAVSSTGSPLSIDGFRWVYAALGADVHLVSASGGTDVCSGFLCGSKLVPVYAGEISCRALGAKVESWTPDGQAQIGAQGELVLAAPMPSMPVELWNDPDRSKLRAAYFEHFPGVWRHGDWITITNRGTAVLSGRSDSTLNRGGVRLGSAEFYDLIDQHPDVIDSVVVHLDAADGPGQLVVLLASRTARADDLCAEIRAAIKANLSPRHVPDVIHVVDALPRTLTGKRLELPIKRILLGAEPDVVMSVDSITNPGALEAIRLLTI